MKKTWRSPQLIILTRSKPEEAVLIGCKTALAPFGPIGLTCEAVPCHWASLS